jgi:FkbM family methyltransferase
MGDTSASNNKKLRDVLGLPLPTVEIMDIGAMDEGEDRYAVLVDQGEARVTGFEPDEKQLASLKVREGPYTYHSVFLGDGKPATFRIARYPGCSSLLDPDPGMIDLFSTIGASDLRDNFSVHRTKQVTTTRLDEVQTAPPDLIKIDVQGAELTVLQNGRQTIANAVVIECEVEFVALYRNQPLFCDIQSLLRDSGFVLHKFVDVAGRCFRPFVLENPVLPMSQLLWADAIFVRDFTKLERYSKEDLLKACQILHSVYHSYDLVSLLLREYDRREGVSMNDRYMSHLRLLTITPMFLNQKAHA